MAIIYVDPENGNDANNGTTFALRKKTLNSATSSRAQGDEIRIIGYPDALLGPAEWRYERLRASNATLQINQIQPGTHSRINLAVTPSPYTFSVGDYICIANSSYFLDPNTGFSKINGIWRIKTVVTSSLYELEDLTLDGSIIDGTDLGQVAHVNSAVVSVLGQYATKLVTSSRWQYIQPPPAGPPPPDGPPPPPPPPPSIVWPTYTTSTLQGVYTASAQVSGTTTDVTYGTPVAFGPGSHWRITTTSTTAGTVGRFVYDANVVTGISTMTNIYNSNADDASTSVSIPFNISFLGTTYQAVFIGSNSYVTFGSGSNAFSNLSASNPNFPKIVIGGADNSYQRLYTVTKGSAGSRTFHIRFEGTASTGGTGGSPNIVWEVIFYEATPAQIDLIVVTHARYTTSTGGSPPAGPPAAAYNVGLSTYFSTLYDPVGDLTSVGIGTTSQYPVVAFNSFPSPLDLSAYDTVSFFVKFLGGTFPSVGTIDLALCSDSSGQTPVYSIPVRSDITVSYTGTTNQSYNWIVHRKVFGAMTTPIQSIAIRVTGNTSVQTGIIFGGIVAGKSGLSAGTLIGRDPSIGQQSWLLANVIEYKYGKTLILGGAPLRGNNQSIVVVRNTPSGHVGLYTDAINLGITTANAYVRTPVVQPAINNQALSSHNITSNYLKITGGWNRTDMSTQDGYTMLNGTNGAGWGINITNYSNLYFEKIGAMQFYRGVYISNSARLTFKDVDFSYCYFSGVNINNALRITFDSSRFANGNYNFYGEQKVYNTYLKNCAIGSGTQGMIYNTDCVSNVIENSLIRNTLNFSYNCQSNHGAKLIGCIFDGNQINYTLYFYRVYNQDFHAMGYHNSYITAPYYSSVGNINYIMPVCTSNNLHDPTISSITPGSQPKTKSGVSIIGHSSGGPNVSSSLTGTPTNDRMTTKFFQYNVYTVEGQTLPDSTTGQIMRFYNWNTNEHKSPLHPYDIPICQGFIPADVQSTFSVYVKKSSSTCDVFGIIQGQDDLGLSTTYTTSKMLHNTNWQQLSISVTPTKSGLAKFYLKAWISSGSVTIDIWGQSIT